jgi:N-acetylneuraminate synthase
LPLGCTSLSSSLSFEISQEQLTEKFISMPVEVIAEIGVNHNGIMEIGLELIDAAAAAGADTVKFQSFSADRLTSRTAPKADYQLKTTAAAESQYEMLRRLEIDDAAHRAFLKRCETRGVRFLSTVTERDGLKYVVGDLGISRVKVPSCDVINAPLLLDIARSRCDLILSTGMSDLEGVRAAIGVLAFGYSGSSDPPSEKRFAEAYSARIAHDLARKHVTLLHCTSEYPAPFSEINLRAMDTLRSVFDLDVGYSDHTNGLSVAIAAAARGARVIEKHFTLDTTMEGPDHLASIEPDEFAKMVRSIREVESALGTNEKMVMPSEEKNRKTAQQSLTALQDIQPGDEFTSLNLGTMRPGNGISPMKYWDWLGKKASHPYVKHEQIEE